jgi:hypothetical protein
MPSFKISLSGILGMVAVIALGLAGMSSPSSLSTAAAATVTLTLLLSAILAALFLSGNARGFWAGFALFGWVYLVLVDWDWVGGQFGNDLTAGLVDIAEILIPDETPALTAPPPSPVAPAVPVLPPALRSTQQLTENRSPRVVVTPPPAVSLSMSGSRLVSYDMVHQRQVRIGNFVEISQMLLTLIFAQVGGLIGRALVQRRESRAGPSGPPSPSPSPG